MKYSNESIKIVNLRVIIHLDPFYVAPLTVFETLLLTNQNHTHRINLSFPTFFAIEVKQLVSFFLHKSKREFYNLVQNEYVVDYKKLLSTRKSLILPPVYY